MEYDNDRIKRPTSRGELTAWAAFIAISPLVCAVTAFATSPDIWPALLVVSILMFPIYFFYSRLIGTVFWARGRQGGAFLLTILTFLIAHALLLSIYFIIRLFPLTPLETKWFSPSTPTLARESVWILVNLVLAIAILHIRRSIDERDALNLALKDNTFFKLKYLRAQMNPHFLFNTLNSIYSLSMQQSQKTPEVVVRLADIMRYLIYECDEEKIPLDKEIEFIRNYIEIEKIRHNADIRFTVEGLTAGIMIEPFLFISFVENGFKHAMDNTFSDPFIYITLRVGDGQIVLNVINSTSAGLHETAKKMSGKGIANSRSLLEILYPDAYELDIIQTEKEENRNSQLRIRNARERLESLYPDNHTLNVILSKSAFTVSLVIKSKVA
jgi:LytS/YehU family sensor histidine kinase